ncbi:MAG: hypothetical protein D6725_08045 [Planctomycetota bacterium]|nr:MAG: hypothetical protein D6725_08045 [Planctomycetota bacterium]
MVHFVRSMSAGFRRTVLLWTVGASLMAAGCSGLGAASGNGKTCRFGEPFEPSGAPTASAPGYAAPQQSEPPVPR